jgi:hypothetical protein
MLFIATVWIQHDPNARRRNDHRRIGRTWEFGDSMHTREGAPNGVSEPDETDWDRIAESPEPDGGVNREDRLNEFA